MCPSLPGKVIKLSLKSNNKNKVVSEGLLYKVSFELTLNGQIGVWQFKKKRIF